MTSPLSRQGDMPRMALRRHQDGTMDDVVVAQPWMFRAEQLDDNCLWLCCYFDGGRERITFHVRYDKKAKCLVYDAGEVPDEWVDIDTERRDAA